MSLIIRFVACQISRPALWITYIVLIAIALSVSSFARAQSADSRAGFRVVYEVRGASTKSPGDDRLWSTTFNSRADAERELKSINFSHWNKAGLQYYSTDKPLKLYVSEFRIAIFDAVGDAVEAVENITDVAERVENIKKSDDPATGLAPKEPGLFDTLKEYKDSIEDAYRRISDAKTTVSAGVQENTEKGFNKINDAIADYNRLAQELGGGPQAGAFADLKPLKPFAPYTEFTGKEAEAQMLLVQTKLKEVGLRVAKRELVEQKEALEVAMQQIAAGKADGIDVSEQEKELAEAITAFESEKSKFQKEIGGYTEFRDKLDTIRKEIKEEKLAADRAKREEEERLAAAKRREEERMAAEKRREEERIAAAREKEMADKIADQNRREAEAIRRPNRVGTFIVRGKQYSGSSHEIGKYGTLEEARTAMRNDAASRTASQYEVWIVDESDKIVDEISVGYPKF